MKAAFIREHGEPEVLEVGELPEPEPGPGEVVVDVRAAALNHVDLWVRRGLPGLDVEFPHVGGADVAGLVEEVAPDVDRWAPGDRVVVNPGMWCGDCEWCVRGEHSLCESFHLLGEHVSGGLAERLAVPEENLYRVPDEYPLKKAAAVPVVFQTAWRGLVSRAGLEAGESVLITGGSGGVATAAVQIAKLVGAEVHAVTSGPENVRLVGELGADHVVDRLEEDFSEVVWKATGKRGVDVVLDSVGEAAFEDCVRSLARNGRLVTYGATTGPRGSLDLRRTFWNQLQVIGSTMASRSEFERVMDLVYAGELGPVIDEVWPMDRVRQAHERLEAGEQFGKIVLTP